MLKKKYLLLVVAFILSVIPILSVKGILLDNDVEVETDSELIYYLDVNYDGIDVDGVESSDTVRANISSGTIYVEDKIPEGLIFEGFVETSDGSIGAYSRSDESISCLGKVVDGVDGLHYDATTNTVSFTVKNLQAGCKITVGIKTKTPATVDDPSTQVVEKRRDFYNTATATEEDYTANSNTVHLWMGSEDATLYKVKYEYEGVVPSNAPKVPSEHSYAAGTVVGVEKNAILEGYTFSGWKMKDSSISITGGTFTMPEHDIVLVGSFQEKEKYNVSYEVNGEAPESYIVPETKDYYEKQVVPVDDLKEGDIIDGYIFKGWKTTDVTVTDDSDFEMPKKSVKFVGEFEEIKYTVTYQFQGVDIPDNAESLLPKAQTYRPGETVTRAEEVKAEGYRFLGWYKEPEFTMPEHDVVIYGEWMVEEGVFEPTITKEVVNQKKAYRIGDTVTYEIKVTNTAEYPIKNVAIQEKNKNAKFVENNAYTVVNEQLVTVAEIKAGETVTIYAEYLVTKEDYDIIVNEVEIISALADDNHHLNPEKEYKATTQVKVEEPKVPNTKDNLFQIIYLWIGSLTVILGIFIYYKYQQKKC